MAVVGLRAAMSTLIVPRTDDCIALLLGSQENYKKHLKQEPGTYFLSKGWIESGINIVEEHYRQFAHQAAEELNLRFEEIEGTTQLLKKMITGPWDSDFVVARPGHSLGLEDFLIK
jgi:hypothetical protein